MPLNKCKYQTIFIIFVLILVSKPGFSQKEYRYSIDIDKTKNRRVPIGYWITSTRTNLKEAKEWRKNKRIEERDSKKIRKHSYKIQKKYVQKRMKQSKKVAEWHNNNKIPFLVKIKKRRYGQRI